MRHGEVSRYAPIWMIAVLLLVPGGVAVDSPRPTASTYLGGPGFDQGVVAETAPDGGIIAAGFTNSSDGGGVNEEGDVDVWLIRLAPDLRTVVWDVLLPGSNDDVPLAIRVASDGVYVAGETLSPDFPVGGRIVFDSTFGGRSEAFLAKFALDGTYQWSTFLGGDGDDSISDVELDPSNRPVVGGATTSCTFPTTDGAYRRAPAVCPEFFADVFVARFWPDGAMNRATLFGGSGEDALAGLAVSASSGSVLIGGTTDSTDLPVSSGAFQRTPRDLYIAKLDGGLGTLTFATYLGGTGGDFAFDLDRDSAGNAFLVGHTFSADFPTTSGAYQTTHASSNGCTASGLTQPGPCSDVFVTKLDATGSRLVYSTFLGGTHDDFAHRIKVAPDWAAVVAGGSYSVDSFLPARPGSKGPADAFVASLAPDGASLRLLTAVGGSDADEAYGLGIDTTGAWITGITLSHDLATSDGAVDPFLDGPADAFIARVPFKGSVPFLIWDHRAGNEWWVEVAVGGATVSAVEAQDDEGPWVPLQKRSWGPWAASFHIEPGHGVHFRALVSGAWIESCWFTHPEGLEQCEGRPGFQVKFPEVKGNAWWIETRIQANQPVAKVEAILNGGPARPLDATSWGTWAKSYPAPEGTVVRFLVTSTSGEAIVSGCYRWVSADPVSCATSRPNFDHRGGNEWWVEALVIGAQPSRMQAQDTNGAWVDLTLRSWGNWAGSFHIEPGHDVMFRAQVNAVWYESCWFSHPAGEARTGGATCFGNQVASWP